MSRQNPGRVPVLDRSSRLVNGNSLSLFQRNSIDDKIDSLKYPRASCMCCRYPFNAFVGTESFFELAFSFLRAGSAPQSTLALAH